MVPTARTAGNSKPDTNQTMTSARRNETSSIEAIRKAKGARRQKLDREAVSLGGVALLRRACLRNGMNIGRTRV